jgi:1,2-phenylacetyl-CoA epoxidase PaaB subunit
VSAPRFNMLLPFDTDDEQFSRGFEAGRVWDFVGRAIADEELPTHTVTVHAANAEMFLRMAEVQGVSIRWEDIDETWAEVTFGEDTDA